MASFLWPLVNDPSAAMRLVRVPDAAVIADRVEAAFDSASRRRGLLGRDGLDAGVALVIAPCSAIHMFFMRFAIDAVFVTRDGVVTKVSSNLAPWRLAASAGAYAVIEMAAGGAHALARGDRLALVPSDAGLNASPTL